MAYNQFDINSKDLENLPRNPESANLIISSLLRANAQDENDAMRKYYQLLTILTDKEDIDIIKSCFNGKSIEKLYKPTEADPVKFSFIGTNENFKKWFIHSTDF